MEYSEFPTVRGNLARFKKFYKIFVELNNKEDKRYLPYPFSKKKLVSKDAIDNYIMFKNIIEKHGYYDIKERTWIMQNILLCFENENNQELATMLFHYTLSSWVVGNYLRPTERTQLPYNSLYMYNLLSKLIYKNIKYFSRELETITQINWEPNS